MRGGRGPKRKGSRVEREVLAILREAGLEARKVPLSGSAPDYPGNLEVELPGLGRVVVEVKARKKVALEAWLEGRGLLVLKADRRPPWP
jgi:Holliday junction resolvase